MQKTKSSPKLSWDHILNVAPVAVSDVPLPHVPRPYVPAPQPVPETVVSHPTFT